MKALDCIIRAVGILLTLFILALCLEFVAGFFGLNSDYVMLAAFVIFVVYIEVSDYGED